MERVRDYSALWLCCKTCGQWWHQTTLQGQIGSMSMDFTITFPTCGHTNEYTQDDFTEHEEES
jgi:hypothetical protein